MKLYDSYSGKIKSLKSNKVDIYLCGPTVYNHIHIGNLRPVIIFDIINRVLLRKGKTINYTHNYTDIDDKIIASAIEQKENELDLSERYIIAYERILSAMNIIKPNNQPKVTSDMQSIINYITTLINKSYAYERNGNVYFKVNSLKEYGSLSNIKLTDLKASVKKEINLLLKENENDFALWKKTEVGIKFDSPWGKGRPGWHSECAAFIDKYHFKILDIHGGGIDLKFPHHENENAQCIAKNNHQLAKIWVHNGHLKVNGEKMSKSLGNYLLAKDAIKQYGANMLRMILLSSPHTQPIDFNQDVIDNVAKQYEKIVRIYKELRLRTRMTNQLFEDKYHFSDKFIYELENNLNIPNAMVVLNDMIKLINKSIANKDRTHLELSKSFKDIIENILGLKFDFRPIDDSIIEMYNQWINLKKDKEFEKADALRYQLIALNVL